MRQTLSRGVFAAAAATGILSLYGAPALADSEAVGAAEDSPGALSGNNVQVPVEVPVNVCGNTIGAGALNEATGNLCANGSHSSANSAAKKSGTKKSRTSTSSNGSGTGGSRALGATEDSPGIASGNNVQVPVHVPVNACGNSVDVVGLMNTAEDNTCENASAGSSGDGSGGAVGVSEGSGGGASGNLIQIPVGVPVNVCGNTVDALGLLSESEDNDCENVAHAPGGPEDDTSNPPAENEVEPPAENEVEPPKDDEEDSDGPGLAETGSNGILAASAAGTGLLLGGVALYRRGRAASRR